MNETTHIDTFFKQNRKEIALTAAGFFAALILCFLLFYTPKPRLTDAPKTTREAAIALKGTAAPNVAVIVFDKDGHALTMAMTSTTGEFTLSMIPVHEGQNTYTLRAMNGRWRSSAPLTLTITKDLTSPSLNVNALQGTVSGAGTMITGQAEPGSTVSVNGVLATVNTDGSWSANVALASGENTLTITATDAAGNTTTVTETVAYTPSSTDSTTGTVTETASSTTLSAGSLPPESTTSTDGTTTSGTTGTTEPTAPGTTSPTAPPPAEAPIQSISATAWVSNPTLPNERSNEIVYVSVKDNFGRSVTNATVSATIYYPGGAHFMTLAHQGAGTYSVSFKTNDKFVSGSRVNVNVTASVNGFTATASTSFFMN